MKTRLLIISSFLTGILILSGCGGDKTSNNLGAEAAEIQMLAERSENLTNAEEAFALLRDLNQSVKDIREIVLTMDEAYAEAPVEEKAAMEAEFDVVNSKIDTSLSIISKNIEPYRNNEKVEKMLNKLNDLLISR